MLDIDYAALGKRIASLRRKKRLTQELLAEKTELSTNYISHIENSRSIPSLETLVRYYDCDPKHVSHVVHLSIQLFKQLRVLHKFSRQYLKVLKIAASLHDCRK